MVGEVENGGMQVFSRLQPWAIEIQLANLLIIQKGWKFVLAGVALQVITDLIERKKPTNQPNKQKAQTQTTHEPNEPNCRLDSAFLFTQARLMNKEIESQGGPAVCPQAHS